MALLSAPASVAALLLSINPEKAVEIAFQSGRKCALSGHPMPVMFNDSTDLAVSWRVGVDSLLMSIPGQRSDQEWLNLSNVEQGAHWARFLAGPMHQTDPYFAAMMRIWINRKIH